MNLAVHSYTSVTEIHISSFQLGLKKLCRSRKALSTLLSSGGERRGALSWPSPLSQAAFKHTHGCVFSLCYTCADNQRNTHGFQGIPSSSHAALLQKSRDFGSCLSCLQPLMIKSDFYFILVFLKAVFLYASQLSPSWKLYSFLSGMKRSSCSE